MPQRYKVEGLVLSRRNSGDADRLVTFYSPEEGMFRAVAKGVRKIPSHRGGHLEPFTKVLALVSESHGMRFVGGIETLDYYEKLHADQEALHHVQNMALVMTKLFEELEPQPGLYELLEYACEILPQLSSPKKALLESAGIMAALRMAGLMPDLQVCQVCKTPNPRDAVILDARQAGWKCLSCTSSFAQTEYSLPPRLFKAVKFISAAPQKATRLAVSQDEGAQVVQAIRRFIADIIEQPRELLSPI